MAPIFTTLNLKMINPKGTRIDNLDSKPIDLDSTRMDLDSMLIGLDSVLTKIMVKKCVNIYCSYRGRNFSL